MSSRGGAERLIEEILRNTAAETEQNPEREGKRWREKRRSL